VEQIFNGILKNKLSQDIHATNPARMPPAITDYVVPVILVTDEVYYAEESFTISGTASNSTTTTILTTDSVKDTYINSVSLGVIKDVTSTSILSTIQVVINGATRSLIEIPGITLTAQSQTISASFPIPIKIDRSSTITINNSSATSNIRASGCVGGFLRQRS